jgi:hypothetical protein
LCGRTPNRSRTAWSAFPSTFEVHLAKRGGAWFERGAPKIHLGVESDFGPARKAHPALLVVDLEALMLKEHNIDVIDDEPLEGYLRVYVADPFGNRIELMEPVRD